MRTNREKQIPSNRRIAEVLFAGHAGGVPPRFEQFGQGGFSMVQRHSRPGAQRPVNAEAVRVTPGEQAGPRSRTNGLGHMKIGKPGAFAGQLVKVRGLKPLGSETADIGVSSLGSVLAW